MKDLDEKMEKTLEVMGQAFQSIRTGRANPDFLNRRITEVTGLPVTIEHPVSPLTESLAALLEALGKIGLGRYAFEPICAPHYLKYCLCASHPDAAPVCPRRCKVARLSCWCKRARGASSSVSLKKIRTPLLRPRLGAERCD